MIKKIIIDTSDWGKLFSYQTYLLKRLGFNMTMILLLTTNLCLIHMKYPHWGIDISATLPGYMGAALGILLVFRINTSYDKWWEARKELGALVNVSRNFAINISSFLPYGNQDKFFLGKLIPAFVSTLKENLRSTNNIDLSEIPSPEKAIIETAEHKPNAIATIMGRKVEELFKKNEINEFKHTILIRDVNIMIDIAGKCERIRSTPIPFAYAMFLKFFIGIYIVILPLGIIDKAGWLALPLVLFLFYFLMSIVLIAEEIEDPFGLDPNDLPMDDVNLKIKKNVEDILEQA